MDQRGKRSFRNSLKKGLGGDKWDDPDSDDGAGGDEEAYHPQTDRGTAEQADDNSEEEALKASDSEGENDGDGQDDFLLQGMAARRQGRPKPGRGGQAKRQEPEGLWDPLADLGPRKRRKVGAAPNQQQNGAAAPAAKGASVFQDLPSLSGTFGFPVGACVILKDLQKAPQLNGLIGTVGSPKDQATGRVQIILRDGQVKSLRHENLKEVLTGAVVRLHGLQGAAELNGRIAECGDLDLTSGRYTVTLADGKYTTKRVKAENVELVKRYVQPIQIMSTQRRAFTWQSELHQGSEAFRQPWADSKSRFGDLGIPAPRLIPGPALVQLLETSEAGSGLALPEAVSAEQVPLDADGRLACRLLCVSCERDTCIPASALKPADVRRLALCAKALISHDQSRPPYFLLPETCVKALSCLHNAALCGWPLLMQVCQGLLCVESEHLSHKAWFRTEALIMNFVLSKPVYILSSKGEIVAGAKSKGGGWLLSDRKEDLSIANPMDGQVLPAERKLLEKMVNEVLPENVRKGSKFSAYRL